MSYSFLIFSFFLCCVGFHCVIFPCHIEYAAELSNKGVVLFFIVSALFLAFLFLEDVLLLCKKYYS